MTTRKASGRRACRARCLCHPACACWARKNAPLLPAAACSAPPPPLLIRAAAEAAAQEAASRAARGWKQDQPPAPREPLPPPDLVTLRLDALQQLLLEGAVLGALLWEAERALEARGLRLTPRPARAAA